MACLLRRDDDGGAVSATFPEQYNNDPTTKVKILQFTTNCDGRVVLKQSFNLRKHLNGKSTDAVSALTSANPTERMFYLIGFGWADHSSSDSNSPPFQIDVQVRYWVKYYEVKDIQGSQLLVQYN